MYAYELPIFKTVKELLTVERILIPHYSNYDRNIYAKILVEKTLGLLGLIKVVNHTEPHSEVRKARLDDLIEEIEELKALVEIHGDAKILSLEQVARLSEFTTSLGKQAQGWKNKC